MSSTGMVLQIAGHFGTLQGVRDYFSRLPPDRYPNIVGNLSVLMNGDGDERFRFGLDLMIEGVAAMAAQQRAPASDKT
jgi:hypothetical protein